MSRLFLLLAIPTVFAAEVMPLPSKVIAGSGKLTIDSSFSAATAGYTDARLQAALVRFVARISRQTGIPLRAAAKPAVIVECKERGGEYPTLGEEESYSLDITASGARISAANVAGALHGLETLAQLIGTASEVESVHIEDHPRFPWRGLMLDVSRHWMPVEVVERNLDAMAAVKLNVFHWHLSDDQGFRVESKRFPKLQQFGSDGNFYTQAEIRRVVEYARDRGIRVVPEFDIPGHTTSWFVGYPEFASAPGPYTIERSWGIFHPTMDPTREETYTFLDDFIGEMAALFPDPYFHIGGDEVEETQWKSSPSIQEFERQHQLADSPALHAYFNQRLQQILKKHGKTMVGWDEVLNPNLGHDTVIQSWRGQASLADAARKGYRGILSFGYYLDHLKPASAHYTVDPLADAPDLLSPQQASQILGGEACMWTEYVNDQTVDSRVWPRTGAVAERLWSARQTTDMEAMYRRLESLSRTLDWVGVQHRSTHERMLGRIGQSDALRVLAGVSEALGIEGRRDVRHYTSEVPLNRFVDAVAPESEQVRRLEQIVRRIVSKEPGEPGDLAELELRFKEWSEIGLNQPAYLASLSHNLSTVGSMGLKALGYWKSGNPAPEKWVATQIRLLEEIVKPNAEVMLAAVRPVRLLLEAVPQLHSNK